MTRITLAMLAVLAFLPLACKQDEGEHCQIDRDCGSGLVCCVTDKENPLLGGTCRASCDGEGEAEAEAEAEGEDAGPDGPADMGEDAGPDGPVDMGSDAG